MIPRAKGAAFLLGLLSLAATFPPRYAFRTIAEGRVRVHFHAETETLARRTLPLVMEILPRLEERYRTRVPRLDVVVHDASDAPNGFATSFPYPLVEIRAAAPEASDSGPFDSWLRLVVTHELAHVVHIEKAGGIWGFGRRIFGRAPLLFPNALQPTWFIEGLAVREETRGTSLGRGRHAFTRAVVDEAARSGQLAKMDQATLGLDRWPRGSAPYLFGSEFLAWVEARFGDGALPDLAERHSRQWIPYLDSRTFSKATGSPLGALWKEFVEDRRARLSTEPPTAGRPLTRRRAAVETGPRLSPDGRRLAYSAYPLDAYGSIRVIDDPLGAQARERRLTRRASGTALSWTRDGAWIVFDESESVDLFETRSDLHRVDARTGRRERLTRGARASDPDVGPDGTIVAVRRHVDRSEIASFDAGSRELRDLTRSDAETEWSRPRFSPDGRRIVAARTLRGASDIVEIDAVTGSVSAITADRALDAEPAWLDDETILFRSDRAGGFDLFVVRASGEGLARWSSRSSANAFAPEPSARGAAAIVARYSADGYALEAIERGEPGAPAAAFVDPFPPYPEEPPAATVASRPYSASRGLAPTFWSPVAEIANDEFRVGAATASFDPLRRVAFGAAGGVSTRSGAPIALGVLLVDRFRPTFTLVGRLETETDDSSVRVDTREASASIAFPIERTSRRTQELAVVVRRKDEMLKTDLPVAGPTRLDNASVGLVYAVDGTKRFPMSISRQDGASLRVSFSRALEALGSDVEFTRLVADLRAFPRFGPVVVAARAGFGAAFGDRAPARSFSVGGFPSPALLDSILDEPALLRGYEPPALRDGTRFGTRIAFANLEVRAPLFHPQRGVGALPFFLRHVHGAVFADAAGLARPGRDFSLDRTRVAVGAQLGADVLVGHRLPVTIAAGVARGLTLDGVTKGYFRLGWGF